MEEFMRTAALKLALYRLYYVDDVYSPDLLDADFAERLQEVYSVEQIGNVYRAIQWALEHRQEQYTQMLHRTKHSNQAILYYLERVAREIEKLGIAP